MRDQDTPLLITSSAVVHDLGVNLKDTGSRVRYTLEAVQQWLRIDPKLRIINCDGSNYDFSGLVEAQFPGSKIECIRFMNDSTQVKIKGRGFGEGEIVRHALEHSTTLNHCGVFAKCSAKLWVDNYPEILEGFNAAMGLNAIFCHALTPWRKTELDYIDTRFYLIDQQVYRSHFIEAHRSINLASGYGLEQAFRDAIVNNQLKNCLLRNPPVIFGVGGGTGVHYKVPTKKRLKERLRLLLARNSQRFAKLF